MDDDVDTDEEIVEHWVRESLKELKHTINDLYLRNGNPFALIRNLRSPIVKKNGINSSVNSDSDSDLGELISSSEQDDLLSESDSSDDDESDRDF